MDIHIGSLLIGVAIFLVGSIVVSIVREPGRRKAEEEKDISLAYHAELKGENKAKNDYMKEFQRFIDLMVRMTLIESAVYGHQRPMSPSWESLSCHRRGTKSIITGTCRGVLLNYYMDRGVATVTLAMNDGADRVDIDLKSESRIELGDELLALFTAKRNEQPKRKVSRADA